MIAIIPLMGYALCRAEEFRDPSIDLSIPVVRAVRSSSVLSGGTARVAKVVQHPGPKVRGCRSMSSRIATRCARQSLVRRSSLMIAKRYVSTGSARTGRSGAACDNSKEGRRNDDTQRQRNDN